MSDQGAVPEWAVKAAEACLAEAREYAVCRADYAHPASVGGGARIDMARIIASHAPQGVRVDRLAEAERLLGEALCWGELQPTAVAEEIRAFLSGSAQPKEGK